MALDRTTNDSMGHVVLAVVNVYFIRREATVGKSSQLSSYIKDKLVNASVSLHTLLDG